MLRGYKTHRRGKFTRYTCDPSKIVFSKEFGHILSPEQVSYCTLTFYENKFVNITTVTGEICGEVVLKVKRTQPKTLSV